MSNTGRYMLKKSHPAKKNLEKLVKTHEMEKRTPVNNGKLL